jgi:hypothetical protein
MTAVNSFSNRNRNNIHSYTLDGQNGHIKKDKKENNKPSGQPQLSVLGAGLPKMLRG